jgi:hypothetical protein
MTFTRFAARIAIGATFVGGALAATVSGLAAPAMASTGPGFSQNAAAPVMAHGPISQVVGSVGAPLVNVNVPCPAPWNQGGLLGANYNACNAAAVKQGAGSGSGKHHSHKSHSSAAGFSQNAAAPVMGRGPISQVVGSVGAPLVNVNVPCPAAWLQGGLLGSRYNACNAAPVAQG